MSYSVGIGLTNACNLACAHCYRPTDRIDYVSFADIQTICEQLPVSNIGMGTGENILHPQFNQIVEYLHERTIKLSIASNGHSLMTMSDEHLRSFNDVEVSIDYPSRAQQDGMRGPGNWDLVLQAIERCQAQAVPVSILATLMCTNYHQMDELARLAQQLGVILRVNVYQAVRTDAYRLSYSQFWEAYQRLFSASRVVSCSEPLVRAVMGLGEVESPCGRTSIRFNMRGQIIPCVYWPLGSTNPLTIADLAIQGEAVMQHAFFEQARAVPSNAAACPCQGGCASRRALSGALADHDEYCPWARGDTIDLPWQPAPELNLVRGRNVCTTIVV
ncbi:MAG: radical SAM protein [Herpetosiphonaceae bacterium]|nr:radical SAM protein [Herpetosiphonaceae bacterium]